MSASVPAEAAICFELAEDYRRLATQACCWGQRAFPQLVSHLRDERERIGEVLARKLGAVTDAALRGGAEPFSLEELTDQAQRVLGEFLNWKPAGEYPAVEAERLAADLMNCHRRLTLLGRHVQSALAKRVPAAVAKGTRGRRGYPIEALNYARQLRSENPHMKAHAIRQACLKKYSEDDMPPDDDSFRRWLNRRRANRAN
jgi:hypothetical protein